jgi:two-component system sensor histidine kinase FlrB
MQTQTDPRVLELSQAFALFNDTSRVLAESYQELERRAADLSRQLAAAHSARLRELAEKERLAERMQALMEALPGGVVVLDADRRVLETNATARALFGQPLLGQMWADVAGRAFAAMGDNGSLKLGDGREFALSQQALADGGTVLLLADVTQARTLQAQLGHYQRLSTLGEMSARLAHQLRTPLSAAMLYASRLAEGTLAPDIAARLGGRTIERLRHLDRLINDMLRYARAEHDDVGERVRVSSLIQRALDIASPGSGAARVTVADCSDNAELVGNTGLLVGALGNLIDNALRVSPSDAVIRLSARRKGGDVVLAVADDGPGVPNALRERVFEPFFTTRSDGTGLGLAVVRSVVSAHGGSVVVAQTSDAGSVFEIRLPEARSATALPGGGSVRLHEALAMGVA